jgi:hypothetical protein
MDQFFRYAKDVAWLLDLKLQQGQEFLAKAYGFSGLHEVAEWMKKGYTAGPYCRFDNCAIGDMNSSSDLRAEAHLSLGRSDRLLDLVREYKGDNGDGLDKRHRLILEFGLFSKPASHKQLASGVAKLVDGGVVGERSDGTPVGINAFVRYWFHRERDFQWPASRCYGKEGTLVDPVVFYGDPRRHEQMMSAERWESVIVGASNGAELAPRVVRQGSVTVLHGYDSLIGLRGFDGFSGFSSSTMLRLEESVIDDRGELAIWSFESVYWVTPNENSKHGQIVAVMRGWHVCPTERKAMPRQETTLSMMRKTSMFLACSFEAVDRVSENSLGYKTVSELMGCQHSGAFTAVEELKIDPDFRVNDLRSRMLNQFKWATFNSPYGSADAAWRANLAGWMSGDRDAEFKCLGDPQDEDEIAELCGSGVLALDRSALEDAGRAGGVKGEVAQIVQGAIGSLEGTARFLVVVSEKQGLVIGNDAKAGRQGGMEAGQARYVCAKCSANLVPKLQPAFGERADKLVGIDGIAGCRGLELECEFCDEVVGVDLELCEAGNGYGEIPTRNGRDFLGRSGDYVYCPDCSADVSVDWDDERLEFVFDDSERASDYEHVTGGYMRLLGRCKCDRQGCWKLRFKVRPVVGGDNV